MSVPSTVSTAEHVLEIIELGTESTPTASLQPGTPEKSGQSSADEDGDSIFELDEQGKPKLGCLEHCTLDALDDSGYFRAVKHQRMEFMDGLVRLDLEDPPFTKGSKVRIVSWAFERFYDDRVFDLGPPPSELSRVRFDVFETADGIQELRLVEGNRENKNRWCEECEEDDDDDDDEDNSRALDQNQAVKLEYLEKCVAAEFPDNFNRPMTGYSHEIVFKDGILLLHFEDTLAGMRLVKWTLGDKDLGPVPSSLEQRSFSVQKKRPREEDPQDEEVDIVGGADELPPVTTVTIEAERRPLKRARGD
jgi:hypothetical protein